MTDAELKKLVAASVTETLKQLGIDTREPFAVQQDFAYLRRSRQRSEGARSKVLVVAIGTIVTGSLVALWEGLKAIMARV